MDPIKDIIDRLKNQLSGELPGLPCQLLMAPASRASFPSPEESDIPPRDSAVLIHLYEKEGRLYIPMIRRQLSNGVHSGQIAFPGGKREPADKNLQETALREAYEEIGLKNIEMQILGALTSLYIPPSHYVVKPYISIGYQQPEFNLQIAEVDQLFEFTVENILKESSKVQTEVITGIGQSMKVPAYRFNGTIIWGASAMIMRELEEILKTSGINPG